MSEYTIYGRDGAERCRCSNLEYHDTWMGEEFITVNIASDSPVDLQIGDYVVYRGLTYSIYSLPTALKQARKYTYGEAFKYEGVKLSARSTELTDIRFLDIVLNDNEVHYTSLPNFSFFCDTVEDLADRLQANTDRNGGEKWLFVTPSYQRTVQRYAAGSGERAEAVSLWVATFGENHTEPSYEKTGVNIQADGISVSDALAFIKNMFGLNFVTRDRTVIIGGVGMAAGHIFRYGKGNGLSTIERTADQDQQVVTKLFAYGSEKNLPLRYYSELSAIPFATVTQKSARKTWEGGRVTFDILLDLIGDEKYFTDYRNTSSGFYFANTEISVDKQNVIEHANGYTAWWDGGYWDEFGPESEGYVSVQFIDGRHFDEVNVGDRIYFLSGVSKTAFPVGNKDYAVDTLPNNMAVNVLMLPGFPKYALSELCRCDYASGKTAFKIRRTPDDEYSTFMEIDGNHQIRFSDNRLRPFLVSPQADGIGIKEGDIHFTEENDDNGLQEVHPSIEGMTEGDVLGTDSTVRVDEISAADMIEDNGVFADGSNIPNFSVTLRRLGFNLKRAFSNAGGSMTLSMKDGYCGGRDFTVKSVVENADGTWKLNVERSHDDVLDLYFPYSYNAATGQTPTADEAYQICQGDHFVLTGIEIEDSSYIWAASVKALRKSILWLLNNDYTRFTYLPKVDELFMARQHEAATTGESLHDTLKSGILMLFEDEDLGIDGSVFIDTLTIKEDGNNGIPTYDVVLRNDKQVGTMQRIQNQISSLSSAIGNGGGGGGGINVPQVRNLIDTYGRDRFLSKVAADIAAGHITFQQGLQSVLTATFGTYNRVPAGSASGENTGAAILPNGTGDFVNLIVKGMVRGNLTVEDALSAASIVFSQTVKSQGALEGERGIIMNAADGTIEAGGIDVRGWLRVETLEKNMIQLMGKDFSFSEGGDIERVEVLDENEGLYLLYMHKEAEGKHTKIADNDILKGKMDELDEGGLYYTSWMQAYPYSPEHSAVTLNDGLLSDTVRVKLFADKDVDGGKNFPPKALMTVTTRGNTVNTNRQHFWELSATDKRLQFLWHVNSPKLTDSNYALVLGMLPHLRFFPTTINYQMPSLFAGGLVVDHQHIHHVNYPVPVDYMMRDLGSWQQGRRYLHGTIIYKDGRCETVTDQLNHNGYTWKCVAPGTFTEQADGTWRYDGGTTAEPLPSSSDWMSVGGGSDGKDGKDAVTVQIISDLGNILRPGSSMRTLTAYVYRGEDDVTSTLLSTAFSWERSTGNETRDTAWNNQHKNIGNTLTISQTDVDFISSFSCIVNLNLTKQQS